MLRVAQKVVRAGDGFSPPRPVPGQVVDGGAAPWPPHGRIVGMESAILLPFREPVRATRRDPE